MVGCLRWSRKVGTFKGKIKDLWMSEVSYFSRSGLAVNTFNIPILPINIILLANTIIAAESSTA